MSNFSSKLSRVRSVKKLSAFTHRHRSPSPNPPSSPPPSRTSTASEELPSSNTKSDYGNMARHSLPRSRTISAAGRTTSSTTANSFGETLRAMSREAQNGEFADVFGSFFFNDKRCQNRAFFMAARLKQTLQTMITPIRQPTPAALLSPAATPPSQQRYPPANNSHSNQQLWEMMTHRLYTLNYILFVLPPTCEIRSRFLNMLEQQLGQIGDGQQVLRRGGMEVHFVVRYVMKHYWHRRRTLVQFHQDDDDDDIEEIVERAREVIEHCLESESKLGHAERDAMYVFHGLRMGLHGTFEPRIELEEDPELKHRLLMTVQENKQVTKQAYVNPFEDADAIVTEDDDDLVGEDMVPSREVDSGFYDHFAPSTRAAAFS